MGNNICFTHQERSFCIEEVPVKQCNAMTHNTQPTTYILSKNSQGTPRKTIVRLPSLQTPRESQVIDHILQPYGLSASRLGAAMRNTTTWCKEQHALKLWSTLTPTTPLHNESTIDQIDTKGTNLLRTAAIHYLSQHIANPDRAQRFWSITRLAAMGSHRAMTALAQQYTRYQQAQCSSDECAHTKATIQGAACAMYRAEAVSTLALRSAGFPEQFCEQ